MKKNERVLNSGSLEESNPKIDEVTEQLKRMVEMANQEPQSEMLEDSETKEISPEDSVEVQNEIERIKSTIPDNLTEQAAQTQNADPSVIENYQRRYLPDYLKGKPGLISKTLSGILKFIERKSNIEGKENIPEGPCLVVCNHFGGGRMGMGDSASVFTAFQEKNVHLSIGREIWWDKSPFLRWIFKKMGGIPLSESLSHLTPEEKEAVVERQQGGGKKVYSRIVENDKKGVTPSNIEYVRQATAALIKGDAVCIYPEGLWLNPEGPLREKQELKQGYRGFELIARQYKKLTGKDLKIVPTAFIEDRKNGQQKLAIGESVVLSDNKTELNDTDWVMARLANMLPEEQRGYYK